MRVDKPEPERRGPFWKHTQKTDGTALSEPNEEAGTPSNSHTVTTAIRQPRRCVKGGGKMLFLGAYGRTGVKQMPGTMSKWL